MTTFGRVTCVTIVAEILLEARLVSDLTRCGARGWTSVAGHGHGPGGHGVSEMEGGNVRIETLVSREVAQRIWSMLEADYFPHYAVTAWAYDVSVARMARYSDEAP